MHNQKKPNGSNKDTSCEYLKKQIDEKDRRIKELERLQGKKSMKQAESNLNDNLFLSLFEFGKLGLYCHHLSRQ